MSVIVKGGSSGNLAEVDAAGELSVGLTANPTTAGYVKVASPQGVPLNISNNGYVFTGQDTLLFSDQVEGTTLNTNLWGPATTTMTVAQSAGFIQLNSGAVTTASAAAQITTNKQFNLNGGHPMVVEFAAAISVGPQANATVEMGIGLASGTTAPTDGAFFRIGSNSIVGVMSFGGVETTTAAMTVPSLNDTHEFVVFIDSDSVLFVIDRATIVTLARPTNQPYPTNATRMPVFARVYNGASAPAIAPTFKIGQILVSQTFLNMNRDWATTLVSFGRTAAQSPATTFGQTANFTNSTAPTNATLSNTTPGYATLGGRFAYAAVAGAATDYALFGYQVPAGFQLFVTSVNINAVVTGAAVATTATILDWGLGLNASAASLATADGTGTWGPRRLALGQMGWVVGDAIGRAGAQLSGTYTPPLVVDSGRYLHVILTIPVGTATASQVWRGSVTVNGYFE